MKKPETDQNYLEAIYILSLKKDKVKAIDICKYLEFSRPTVSIAIKDLEKCNLIKLDGYNISLTEQGKKIALEMYDRHEYIAKVLMKIGVSENTAYEDSCLIEHDLSDESFKAIKNATKNMKL